MTTAPPKGTVLTALLLSALATMMVNTAFAQGSAPDTIYVNGNIVTVDSAFSIAQAFAVRGDRFVAVGDNTAMRQLARDTTRVVDLAGATVVPGFIDAHAHTVSRLQYRQGRVSMEGAMSIAEIVRRIGAAAAKTTPGQWIVTTYIGESPDYFNLPENLAEKRWPTRLELDKGAPRNPVFIPGANKWPHPSICNSVALELIGVSDSTPDDGRMVIERDRAGAATGLIYGLDGFNKSNAIRSKLLSMLPPVPSELRKGAIKTAIAENIAAGVTTIYEGHGTEAASVALLRALESAGELRNRVVVAYEISPHRSIAEIDTWMAGLDDAKGTGSGSDLLKVVGVTATLDGGPTQFGAAVMHKPYIDPHGRTRNGVPDIGTEKMIEIARLAVKYNLRLNVVGAGDKAAAMAIEAIEAVNRETPITDRQWVIQHIQHPSREDIAKVKDLGMVATTYSSADYSKGAETYIKRFPGQDIWRSVVPLRWWLDSGALVAQSTDGAHYEPMFTIWESLIRVDGRTGRSLLTPEKTISRREAIGIYTINGAKVLQWGDRLGSIEAGKLADFVVLDRDILAVPVAEIRETKVLLTALGGDIVYGALPLRVVHGLH